MNKKKHNWIPILLAMPHKTNRELADEYNINIKVVSNKRRKMKMPTVKNWDRYKDLLSKVSDSEIAKKMGISANAVTIKRLREGKPAIRDNSKEAAFQKKFIKTLSNYKEYVTTIYGEIDVLTDDTIYECKSKSRLCDIHRAVGQLLLYSNAFPNRKLIILVPHIKVNPEVLDALQKLNIDIVEYNECNTERMTNVTFHKKFIVYR